MTLKPLGNKFTFTFVDNVVVRSDMGKRRTQFEETTKSGITISSYDEGTKLPRWCVVKDIGPDVGEFSSGDKVLIEPLKWSEVIELGTETFWYSDEMQVMAVEIAD
jgi:hypothetical protein